MTGHRLRVIRLVPMPGVGYGSGNYGDGTYGGRNTELADLQRYEIVPDTSSATEYPLIWRRATDTAPPFTCRLVAYASEYENVERTGTAMDLSGVETATMRLMAISTKRGGEFEIDLPMEVLPGTPPTRLQRVFTADDFNPARVGEYRMTISLVFSTGRRMTIAPDDRFTVVIEANRQSELPY